MASSKELTHGEVQGLLSRRLEVGAPHLAIRRRQPRLHTDRHLHGMNDQDHRTAVLSKAVA